jgi:uncharacterized protein (DUF58 family)
VLTRSGWGVLAGAAGLLIGGRLLGAFELYLLGAGVAALVVVALLATHLSRLELGLTRVLVPARVHAGSAARVELGIANHGTRRSAVLRLHDAVSGTRGAHLLLSTLAPSEHTRAAYQLPTDRRGALVIGPLEVVVGDPFGLSESRTEGLGTTQLIVYPHIIDLPALDLATGYDPQATARRPNALGRVGDDFYALRPYVHGDDLRRVHWPSVAHTGELMIRQHEMPWQERTTVLLDVRTYGHTATSFELAASAAASILVAASGRGDQIRLVTTDRSDSGFGLGRLHLDAALQHLALAQLDQGASFQATLDDVGRRGGGGTLVVVLASLATDDLARYRLLGRRFANVVTVLFEPSSHSPGAADGPAPMLPNLVRVTGTTSLLEAWTMLGRRPLTAVTDGTDAAGDPRPQTTAGWTP